MTDTAKDLLVGFVPIFVALIGVLSAVITGNKKTHAKVDKVQSELDKHIKEDEFRNASQTRARIIRADNELRRNGNHANIFTDDYWTDILDDCDFYEKFAEEHKGEYKNSKGKIAIENLKSVYAERSNND